jgi:hypothetical protein
MSTTDEPAAPVPSADAPRLGPTDACNVWAETILEIRRALPEHERRIAAVQALIDALQGRAGADPARLQALQAELHRQTAALEQDLNLLRAFTDEFTANCPPRPDI